MSFAASHSWALPPLTASISTPSLAGGADAAGKRRPPGRPVPRRFGFNQALISAAPPSCNMAKPPAYGASTASFASGMLDIEMRLRERLAQEAPTSAGTPSRARVQAVLDALRGLSSIPSSFSACLPLIADELTSAAVAPGQRGASDGVSEMAAPAEKMLYYFEVVDKLREQIKERKLELQQLQQQLYEAYAVSGAAQSQCQQMRERCIQVDEQLKVRKDLEKMHAKEIARCQREYALLQDERNAIDVRCGQEEAKCRAKDDKIKEVQVLLFVEQKRTMEQTQLYKELRAKKNQEAQAAAAELMRCQRALLRSHQAYLRSKERRRDASDLNLLGIDEQIQAAIQWAESDLDAVDCEETGHFAQLDEVAEEKEPPRFL